jgi:hypothetical protein
VDVAGIHVTAFLIDLQKALWPGARAFGQLDDIDQPNLARIAMQAIAAAAPTSGIDNSCVPEDQQNLRQVVGRNIALFG